MSNRTNASKYQTRVQTHPLHHQQWHDHNSTFTRLWCGIVSVTFSTFTFKVSWGVLAHSCATNAWLHRAFIHIYKWNQYIKKAFFPYQASKEPLMCVSWIWFNIWNKITEWPENNKIFNLSSYFSSLNIISLCKCREFDWCLQCIVI